MSYPVVLDIETQNTFQEVGNYLKKLKISVVGIYDYADCRYETYLENELGVLFSKLEKASFLIGFNINNFDLPVLATYYLGSIKQFATLDLLEEVEKELGFRVALDDLSRATLAVKKSGHGFMAINYFKNGQWDKLKSYCLKDVEITRHLYEYGKKNGKVLFNTVTGIREIKVKFSDELPQVEAVALSLPF